MIDKFIQDIARTAGNITLKYFNNTQVAYTKKDALDIVTHADLASNKIIIDSINKNFPNDGIITEETEDYKTNSDAIWIIDPLDGTLNFSKGIPLFCILIAHSFKGKIDTGVIYDPVHNEMYYAASKKGAFLNGSKIHSSVIKEINYSVGCFTGIGKEHTTGLVNKLIDASSHERIHISSLLSIGLSCAQVASGKRDWFISTAVGGDWDYAAGKIILEEAGCTVTNIHGKPWQLGDKTMIAANPKLHKKIMNMIKPVVL